MRFSRNINKIFKNNIKALFFSGFTIVIFVVKIISLNIIISSTFKSNFLLIISFANDFPIVKLIIIIIRLTSADNFLIKILISIKTFYNRFNKNY